MDGIGWAASAMQASSDRLDIAAKNLANGSTDGFRRSVARGTLAHDGVRIDTSAVSEPGVLRRTGRPFDLAIVGRGAFCVRAANGRIGVTRAGSFVPDAHGVLRDARGAALLGSAGPVVVAPHSRIESDGRILSGGEVVNQLRLPRGSALQTGALESSNVDAIGEMIDVLAAQRSFEGAQKAFSAIDAAEQKTSGEVARLK